MTVVACVAIGLLPVLNVVQPDAIDRDRAVSHVAHIAQEPHPMGSAEIERVRGYLTKTLIDSGITPQTQTVESPDYFGAPGATVSVSNVIARIEGTEGRDDALLLMAHHDTVPTTPGANDNSAAVAAMLEVGRVLADDPPADDVILLFTDGEEPTPRFGATAFADHPWFGDVRVAANFEGIGVAGPALLVELEGPAREMVHRLAESTDDAPAFSFMTKMADLIGGAATDFDVFRDAGVPGYNFAFLQGSSIYHSERDDIDSLNVDGMEHQAGIMVGLARNLGAPVIDDRVDPAVFFTLPGGPVARYGVALAMVTGLFAVGIAGFAVYGRVRDGESTAVSVLVGAGLVLAIAITMVAILTFVWMGVVSWRATMGLAEGYLWALLLGVLLVTGWFGVRRRSARTGSDLIGGTLAVWAFLSILTALVIPEWSYVFTWPTMAAGLVLIVGGGSSPGIRLVLLIMVALPTAVVLAPVVDTLVHLASPRPGNPDSEIPAAIAVPLFLAFLGIGLVGHLFDGRHTE